MTDRSRPLLTSVACAAAVVACSGSGDGNDAARTLRLSAAETRNARAIHAETRRDQQIVQIEDYRAPDRAKLVSHEPFGDGKSTVIVIGDRIYASQPPDHTTFVSADADPDASVASVLGMLLLLEHVSDVRELDEPRKGAVRRFSFDFDTGIDRGTGTADVRNGSVTRLEWCSSATSGQTCLDIRLRFRDVEAIEAPPSTSVAADP
jgi:hypothetical protein